MAGKKKIIITASDGKKRTTFTEGVSVIEIKPNPSKKRIVTKKSAEEAAEKVFLLNGYQPKKSLPKNSKPPSKRTVKSPRNVSKKKKMAVRKAVKNLGESLEEQKKQEELNKLLKKFKDEPDKIIINKKETVNNPDHYGGKHNHYEVIKIIESITDDLPVAYGFCLANAVKYILRHHKKNNPKEDLRKAMWYLNRIITNDMYSAFNKKSTPKSSK